MVIGTNIMEYINEDDHEELIYNLANNEPNHLISFTNRFKSTLIKTQTPMNINQSFMNQKIKNANNGWRVYNFNMIFVYFELKKK